MKSEVLEREILTHLERKLLNDVIRPAISPEKKDYFYGNRTVSETLDFKELLEGVKKFYRNNGGDISKWNHLMLNIDL